MSTFIQNYNSEVKALNNLKLEMAELEDALACLKQVRQEVTESKEAKKFLKSLGNDARWIPGYDLQYAITKTGEIWSVKNGLNNPVQLKTPVAKISGYRVCYLHKTDETTGKSKGHTYTLGRVLAASFLNLDLNNPTQTVDHKDFNRLNDDLSNLEVVSLSENIKRAKKRWKENGNKRRTKAQLEYDKGCVKVEWCRVLNK